jgi:hypothetical protein
MAEFADGLDHDLRKIKEDMAEHAQSADSYFEGVKAHADHLKVKLQNSMEAITTDFKASASLNVKQLANQSSRRLHHPSRAPSAVPWIFSAC